MLLRSSSSAGLRSTLGAITAEVLVLLLLLSTAANSGGGGGGILEVEAAEGLGGGSSSKRGERAPISAASNKPTPSSLPLGRRYAEYWHGMMKGLVTDRKKETGSSSSSSSQDEMEAEFFGRLGEVGVLQNLDGGTSWLPQASASPLPKGESGSVVAKEKEENEKQKQPPLLVGGAAAATRGGGGSGSLGLKSLLSEDDFFRLLQVGVGKWMLREVADDLFFQTTENGGKKNYKGQVIVPKVEPVELEQLLLNAQGSLEVGQDVVLSSPFLKDIESNTIDEFNRLLKNPRSQEGGGASTPASRRALKQFFQSLNMTVIIRDADGRHPVLADLASYWNKRSGGYRTGVSLYWTPAGAISGVADHIDSMDVLAIQVSGSKRWSYESNCHPLPLPDMVPTVTLANPLPYHHRCGTVFSDEEDRGVGARESAQQPKKKTKRTNTFFDTKVDASVVKKDEQQQHGGGVGVKKEGDLPSLVTHFPRGSTATLKPNDLIWLNRGVIHSTVAEVLPPRFGGGSNSTRKEEKEELGGGGEEEEGSLHISLGIECSPSWTVSSVVQAAMGRAKNLAGGSAGLRTGEALTLHERQVALSNQKLIQPSTDNIAGVELRPAGASYQSKKLLGILEQHCLHSNGLIKVLFHHLSHLPQMAALRRVVAPAFIPYHETRTNAKLHGSGAAGFTYLQAALKVAADDIEKYFPLPNPEKEEAAAVAAGFSGDEENERRRKKIKRKTEEGLIRWCEFLSAGAASSSPALLSLESWLDTATPIWHDCAGAGSSSGPTSTVYRSAERVTTVMHDIFDGVHCRRLVRGGKHAQSKSTTTAAQKQKQGRLEEDDGVHPFDRVGNEEESMQRRQRKPVSGKLGEQGTLAFLVWTRQEVSAAFLELLTRVQQVPYSDFSFNLRTYQTKLKTKRERDAKDLYHADLEGVSEEWAGFISSWRQLHVELATKDRLDASVKFESSLDWDPQQSSSSAAIEEEDTGSSSSSSSSSATAPAQLIEVQVMERSFKAWRDTNIRLWEHSTSTSGRGGEDGASPKSSSGGEATNAAAEASSDEL